MEDLEEEEFLSQIQCNSSMMIPMMMKMMNHLDLPTMEQVEVMMKEVKMIWMMMLKVLIRAN